MLQRIRAKVSRSSWDGDSGKPFLQMHAVHEIRGQHRIRAEFRMHAGHDDFGQAWVFPELFAEP